MALFNGERVYPQVTQFFPQNQQPIGVTEGGMWYDNVGKRYLAIINGIATPISSTILTSNNIFTGTNTFNNTVSTATATPATSGANQSSPQQCFNSNYWTGSASAVDQICWQAVPQAGSNPGLNLVLSHSGSSGGFSVDATLASVFKTGQLQITNGVSVNQLLEVGGSTGNAWQFPLANPANPNMFLMGFGGNPNQLAWKNAPWSSIPIDQTGQNAAIGTTAWTSTALLSGPGQYRVTWNAKVTTAAGTSSTLGPLTITYVDPDGTTQTITAAAQSKAGVIETSDTGNSTTTVLLGIPFLMNASGNITYAFGYASNAANAMVYNLHLRLEAIQ